MVKLRNGFCDTAASWQSVPTESSYPQALQGMLASELAYAEEELRGTAEMTERHGAAATQLQDALAAVRQLASAVIVALQVSCTWAPFKSEPLPWQ